MYNFETFHEHKFLQEIKLDFCCRCKYECTCGLWIRFDFYCIVIQCIGRMANFIFSRRFKIPRVRKNRSTVKNSEESRINKKNLKESAGICNNLQKFKRISNDMKGEKFWEYRQNLKESERIYDSFSFSLSIQILSNFSDSFKATIRNPQDSLKFFTSLQIVQILPDFSRFF